MSARTQHVVPHGDQWAVKGEGSKRVTVFPTKREAIDAARKIADDLGTDMLVHGKLGQIFYPSPAESSLDEEMIRQAVRKTVGVSNLTDETVEYRVVGSLRAARGKSRSQINGQWYEVLSKGTLAPHTYVTMPGASACVVQFQRNGKLIAEQEVGEGKFEEILVALIPNGEGAPKLSVCRRLK